MTYDEFKAAVAAGSLPAGVSDLMQALWHAANNNWDAAHELAQASDGPDGAWVHAHLHRIEGDLSNAGYWYRRAGKAVSTAPLPQEWDEIAKALL